MKSICVYCGSSPGARPEYAAAAAELGATLARDGITLVYGGSNVGLMRVVAESAMAAGGRVVGVMPRVLIDMEVVHRGLTELVEVGTMHERKFAMAERADGFIAMPGGIGTLEELSEIFVWSQLAIHRKPVALLNVAGFYDPLVGFLRHMVTERFLRAEQLGGLIVEGEVAPLMSRMRGHVPLAVDKWIDRA